MFVEEKGEKDECNVWNLGNELDGVRVSVALGDSGFDVWEL